MFIKLLIFYRLHESPFGPVHTFSFNSRAIQDWVCGHNFSVLVIASAILESHLLADFFFFLLKCFPFSFHLCGIAMRNFVVSLAFQRHPHHLLVICLLVKNVPRCQALSALLHVWRLSSSSHIRLYVLSPWPLQRRRNLAECADVRVVATVKEWCFAEEILDLAF